MAKVESWSVAEGKRAEVLETVTGSESAEKRAMRLARQDYTPEERRERFAAMRAWEAACDYATGGRAEPEPGLGSMGL